jgi:hypothetical protein
MSATRALVLSAIGAVLVITPAYPLAVMLLLVGLVFALRAPPERRRTVALVVASIGLVASVLLLPLFLMFLDDAGFLRG